MSNYSDAPLKWDLFVTSGIPTRSGKIRPYLEVGCNPVAIQFGEAETSTCTNYSNLIRHVLNHASIPLHTTVLRMRSRREVPPGSATIW